VAQSSIDFVRKLIVERRANRGRDL
jgi:hypothetical protein